MRLAIFRGDGEFIRQHLPQLGYGEGGDTSLQLRVCGDTSRVRQLPVDPPKHTLLPHSQLFQPLGKLAGTHLLL